MKGNIAIKIFGLAWLVIVFLLIGFSAGKSTTNAEQAASSDEMFVVIEDHSFLGYSIVYDKDTKIIYFKGFDNSACLDPLYNPDGTLKLYNGGN